jgi:spermidine/putrescine transport system substrate-binding protein
MKKVRSLILLVVASVLLISCSSAGIPATGNQSAPTASAMSTATTPAQAPATMAPTAAPTMAATTAETMAAPAATEAPASTEAAASTEAPASALAPVTSKELNLYGWSEYVPEALLKGFEQEYGVKVNYDTYSSNEEMVAKLQAGASGYDVIIPSDYMVTILAKQGLIQPIDLSQVPNIANVDSRFRGLDFDPKNEFTVPYQWGTVGLVVNRDKVKGPVDSWSVLWDPAYQGRVVLLDDTREVIGMVLLTLGHEMNATDPAQLNEAKDKLTQLVKNVRLFDSDNPKAALLSGEAWLGQTWNGEAALAHRENPQIDYICPKEGCTIWFDNLAIPKDAPHKDAAQAFLNYVLRPDVSVLITQEFPYSNPNKAALDLLKTKDPALYESYMGFRATNPTEDDLKNAKMVIDVGDATTLYDQIYTEIKGGQ